MERRGLFGAEASARKRMLVAIATALAAGLLTAPAAFGGAGSFTAAPGSPFSVGEEPRNLVSGDFDQDGSPDLAVANSFEHNVSILLGSGEGRFEPAAGSPEATSEPAVGIDSSDFDDDGDLDLAIASWGAGPSNVSILLGDGTGDFSVAGAPIDPGFSAAVDLLATDFDDDGDPDLAVVDLGDDDVTILLGAGDGTFAEAPGSPVAVGGSPQAVAMGDLNGDADVDLAVPNRDDGTVTLLLGDGTGGFSESPGGPLAVRDFPRAIATAQLDDVPGDDLAVASGIDNTVTVLLNDGSGDFSAAPSSPIAASGASYVEPADLDGDGSLDLAIAGGGSEVLTFRNDGVGRFTRFSDQGEETGSSPLGIVAANLDGSGLPDLAVANFNSDDVSVLLNESWPSLTIKGVPFRGRATNDPTPSYELLSDDPEADMMCRIDADPWQSCPPTGELGPLADGEHRFRAWAIDAIGNYNPRPAHRRFVVDTELQGAVAAIPRVQQRRGGRIAISGSFGAAESVVGVLRARVRTGGRTYVLNADRGGAAADARRQLEARASRKASGRIAAQLAAGKSPHVRAWLKVKDPAGNAMRVKRIVRLMR